MKVIKILLVAFTAFFFISSCQKELSLEQGLSVGTLKEDGTGFCLPSSIGGIFKEDSLLNTTNYIELQVDISQTGSYNIKSDTINGYSFAGSGSFDLAGLNTIRLFASGKPIDPGINSFTITFDSSSCIIDIPVITVGPPAVYTLGGTGSTCTGANVSGIYAVSVPMLPGNTATIDVNVTTTGSYSFTTPIVNGISFSASGDFTITGPQTVTLNATGTPTAAGTVNFTVSGNSGSCTFPVTISNAPSLAVYTFGGAGSTCTGFVTAGTYSAGTALNATNTVTINVNVTTVGGYAISTTAANGVTFSKLGIFTLTGPQTVTLTGSGTPTAAGVINHTVNGGGGNCTFTITYTGGAPAAAFTLSGAPGNCTVATVAGTYTVGTPLNASNTVTVQVNVTTVGAYSLSTTVVNGISFSGSGTFTATGPQSVVLTGSGTPTAAGTPTFSFNGATSCTFSVTINGGGGGNPGIYSASINGAATTSFTDTADAIYYTFPSDLGLEGYVSINTSSEFLNINIDKQTLGPGTAVTAGTYTNSGSAPNQYVLIVEYIDNAGNSWVPRGFLTQTSPPDPFTVTVTSITATRVIGTFSGTVRDAMGTGTMTKTFTNGVFNLPLP
ncbi:MAG: hypothetical protein WKF35_11585 [Ferruginibacter sp.]